MLIDEGATVILMPYSMYRKYNVFFLQKRPRGNQKTDAFTIVEIRNAKIL
jgi:hypothetical protein